MSKPVVADVRRTRAPSVAVNRRRLLHIWRARTLYIMIAPAVIYFAIFTYYPLIKALIMSFQDYRLIGYSPPAGFANYQTVLADPVFWQVLVNTCVIGGGLLVVGFILPLLIAVSLREVKQRLFARATQSIIYLPHLFSWVVVGGIWIYLLQPNGGLVNTIIAHLGGHPIPFLQVPGVARAALVGIGVWKDMGFNAIIFIAGLAGIERVLYEAARVDGANRWGEFMHVTLPGLTNTMKVVFIFNLLGFFSVFQEIYIMDNPAIDQQVNVLMTYLYHQGIINFQFGYVTAASFIVAAATLLVAAPLASLLRFDLPRL
jgi:putative aldouronate transport system permease protein